MRVYILVNFVCEHKVGVHVDDILMHEVLCDILKVLHFQGASGPDFLVTRSLIQYNLMSMDFECCC